jgi:predicted transport protein
MAKSPEEMKASMIAGMAEKTGKPLEDWVAIVRASGLAKHKEFMTLLKEKHGLTHGFANLVALQALQSDSHTAGDTDALVDAQYAGAKAGLRPLYDQLLAAIQKFGKDVDVSPKKAYVSLRRNKQFALVQPSTATRLDVGINLKGTEPTGRLEASGSFNSMVSHRVRVSKAAEIDKELLGWLKQAYEAS